MIGQTKLRERISNIKNFPRFSIITGSQGSGKKTLCKEIAKSLGLHTILVGCKIEDVRNAIDTAYTQYDPLLFILCDADNMSVAAKNSLLKITEEPPKNAYFIMTLQSIENTLSTIQSRGVVFNLEPYTEEELIAYRAYRGYSDIFDEVVKLVCISTGEVDELFSYDVAQFYSFCKTVVDYINVPRSGNAFKITKSIKIKDTDKGYDIKIFLKAVQKLFFKKAIEEKDKKYLLASLETAKTIRCLKSISISKLALLDLWIMNVRLVLR